MSGEKKTPVDKLNEMLGYDPSKPANPTAELFKELKDELQEQRQAEAKEKARKVLNEAIQLNNEFQSAKRNFAKQEEKFMKNLGKLVSQIERASAVAEGREPPAEEPEEGEEPSES